MNNVVIKNWVNICIIKDNKILLLDRKHDNFKGWIPPGGKVDFPETFTEAAIREVKEETGLIVKNLKLKGISGFINPIKREQFVFYDFVCDDFSGEVIQESREGNPKWWNIDEIESLEMQKDIKTRLPFYFRDGTFERIHYWDEEKKCVGKTKTILYE